MDLLDKLLKLVDIQIRPKADQLGVVNIKIENKTFNYSFSDPETARAFASSNASIPPELQKQITEDTRKRLKSIARSLEMVSNSTAIEIVAANTAMSTLKALEIKTKGDLATIGDVAYVKISETSE